MSRAFVANYERVRRKVAVATVAAALFVAGLPARSPDEPTIAIEPEPGTNFCATAPSAAELASLRRHLSQLDRARSSTSRCAALHRFIFDRAADDTTVARLTKYAQPSHASEVRTCAVQTLGHLPLRSALSALLELAKQPAPSPAIAEALAAREEPAARNALRRYAHDAASPLRLDSAVALAELGETGIIDRLAEIARGDDSDQRGAAIAAIGRSRDLRALEVLQSLYHDREHLFGYDTVRAIGELGSPESTRLLLDLLQRTPQHAQDLLAGLARSSDPEARRALVSAAESGATSTFALEALSHDEGEDVRAIMVRALASVDAGRIKAASIYFSLHPDPRALPALRKLTAPGADDALLDEYTLIALTRSAGPEAMKDLEAVARAGTLYQAALNILTLLPDGVARARAIALELAQRDVNLPLGFGDSLAGDPAPEARELWLRIARLGGPLSERAVVLLARRADPPSRLGLLDLARSHAPTRWLALRELAAQRSPEGIGMLRGILKSSDPEQRAKALNVLAEQTVNLTEAELLEASRDPALKVAAAALTHLAALGTPAAIARIEQLATSPDHELADDALQQLRSADHARAIALIQRLASSGHPGQLRSALRGLADMPEPVIDQVLQRALRTNDAELVSSALAWLDDPLRRARSSKLLLWLEQRSELPEHVRDAARAIRTHTVQRGSVSSIGYSRECHGSYCR